MPELKFKIDFNKLADIAHRGARRAVAFIALGEKAWSDQNLTSVALKMPFAVKMLPDPLPKELADQVRVEFRLSVLSSALVELMQCLALFADDYYRYAVMLAYHGKPFPLEARRKIENFNDDTNLRSKLERLERDCTLKSPLLDHAEGWAKARNALSHSYGIVRERHCDKDAKELTVSWRKFEILVGGKPIQQVIGTVLEADQEVAFRLAREEKKFALGSKVDFSEEEIVNICLTAVIHSSGTVKLLEARAKEVIGENKEDPPKKGA